MASGPEAHPQLWKTLTLALDAELREDVTITGSSGLNHPVQAIAVDESSRRVIIISAEASPRMAALMQVDVQVTMPDFKVLVARPVAVDLGTLARKTLDSFGIPQIDVENARVFFSQLSAMPEEDVKLLVGPNTQDVFKNALAVYEKTGLPAMTQILDAVMQAERIPWKEILRVFGDKAASGTLDLRDLLQSDGMKADLAAGVCPIPLYEFTEADFEIFESTGRVDEARSRLRGLGVLQYFFPPTDHISLGLVDQGVSKVGEIVDVASELPAMGHPFGTVELIDSPSDLVEVIGQLHELGYVAEGEHGYEVSEKGRSVRSIVKFRPREGLLTKLLNRVSLSASISPKDFIK